MYNTEVKPKSAINFDLSVKITDPDTIKTMVADSIETFKNTKPAVNQEFVQNSQKTQQRENTWQTVLQLKNWYQKVNFKLQKIVKVKGFAGDSAIKFYLRFFLSHLAYEILEKNLKLKMAKIKVVISFKSPRANKPGYFGDFF